IAASPPPPPSVAATATAAKPTDLAPRKEAKADAPPPPARMAPRALASAAPGGGGRGGDDAWGFAAPQAQFSGVKAGEGDDNATSREFQKFPGTAAVVYPPVDLRYRRFLVVRDAQGKPIPRCRVKVSDNEQHQASFLTTASGRAIFFPKGEGLTGASFKAN